MKGAHGGGDGVLYFLNVFGVEGNHVLDQILLNVELEGKLLCLGVDVVL